MKITIYLAMLLLPVFSFAQSDLVKGSELLLNGLSFLKSNKEAKASNSKFIESVCIKNKLQDKITFILAGKDEEENVLKKELVIPKEGKECVFELPKGIYTYEIILSTKEVFKKGEYKFEEQLVITIKE